MESAPALILRTLDSHLSGAGEIRLLGGAALILGYGRNRTTEDADLLLDDRECQVLIEHAGFSEALDATNRDLEAKGLYLTHIWGPEQQILTPSWRENCRRIDLPSLVRLRVTALGPFDLITSKLARADRDDLADIAWLMERERLTPDAVMRAVDSATVPAPLAETFPAARERLVRMLQA